MTKEQLESMYNSGMSQSQIAEHFHFDQKTVYYWMKKWGIKARPRGGRRNYESYIRSFAARVSRSQQ